MQYGTDTAPITEKAGLWQLAPERLDDENAAQHHQADHVNCFFQGGSLAGATSPAQFSKSGTALPRSDRYVNIAGTFIATHGPQSYRRNPMKPYVICHMCTSIDGRILPSRWSNVPTGARTAGLFETTAASFGIGAWVVGTTTMKEFADGSFKLKA